MFDGVLVNDAKMFVTCRKEVQCFVQCFEDENPYSLSLGEVSSQLRAPAVLCQRQSNGYLPVRKTSLNLNAK